MRVNWQLKAIWPVAVVLLNGMLLFLLATVSLQDTERHRLLLIAGSGAVAICGVVIVVLVTTINRPMIELAGADGTRGGRRFDGLCQFRQAK